MNAPSSARRGAPAASRTYGPAWKSPTTKSSGCGNDTLIIEDGRLPAPLIAHLAPRVTISSTPLPR